MAKKRPNKGNSRITFPKNYFFNELKRVIDTIRENDPEQILNCSAPQILIAVKDCSKDHVHICFPDDEHCINMINTILKEKGIKPKETSKAKKIVEVKEGEYNPNRKIVFRHKRALGDCLMFTSGIRDFKALFSHIKINVDSNQAAIWKNNPHIDETIKKEDDGVEYYEVGYPMGDVSRSNRHFTSMFLFDMIAQADAYQPLTNPDGTKFSLAEFCAAFGSGTVGDPSISDSDKNSQACEPFISWRQKYRNICGDKGFTHQKGEIFLTEKEKNTNIIKDFYGVDKYWVIGPGGKRDCTCKVWDWPRFQEVIDYFDGHIKFVTVGRSDHLVTKFNNVIDLTDKFGTKDSEQDKLRELFSVVYNAEGVVAGVSFLNHLAAAMPPKGKSVRKPCVVVWGGREPSGWCYYTNHQVLHTNGIFTCCDDGGCWKSRTYKINKDVQHNDSLCSNTVSYDGRTIPACMHSIKAEHVIQAIEKYYSGNIYSLNKEPMKVTKQIVKSKTTVKKKENKDKKINLLGNLNTDGGGEQSLCKIAEVLDKAGWDVVLYPWGTVHEAFRKNKYLKDISFKSGKLEDQIREDVPLLFYANDCVWDFAKNGERLVKKCSELTIGINFMNGDIPRCKWLAESGKLRGVVFQSSEKRDEFIRDAMGFDETDYYVIAGAIDLNSMLEVCPKERKEDEPFVVLKHGKPDGRKYVTEDTQGKGDKVHVWQKNFGKDLSVKFYDRLLKDTKNTIFKFMSAPKEVEEHFKDEKRMVFYKWNEISVEEFLSQGHIYLDHLSNDWRHQYPRTIGEALAAGLPVLCEPRDGPLDRVFHGDSGFFCVDYDQYQDCVKKLQRKEKARQKMGQFAKDWARENLRPENWVKVLQEIF